jgi:DNA repair photolyase
MSESQTARPTRQLTKQWQVLQHPKPEDKALPGCKYGCIYCNQAGMDVSKNGEDMSPYITTTVDSGISLNTTIYRGDIEIKKIPITTIVNELKEFPYYSSQEPLVLENFSDPSLDWGKSFELVESLMNIGHSGPIILITKGSIPKYQIEKALDLKNRGAELFFIITYSGLPETVEPIPKKGRILTLHKLNQAGIPAILSIRPLIEGLNTSKETIRQVIEQAGKHSSAIISGGLYVFDFTHESFRQHGIQLSNMYDDYQNTEFKLVDRSRQEDIRRIVEESGYEVPVFKHTTCAIAYLRSLFYNQSQPDRLAHWAMTEDQFEDCAGCDENQMALCQKAKEDDVGNVIHRAQEKLAQIGYKNEIIPSSKKGVLLLKEGSLHLSELFFIVQACGWQVENLPSINRLLHHLNEVLPSNKALTKCEYEKNTTSWIIEIEPSLLDKERDAILEHLWRKLRSHFISIKP